jgi:hypothetical protein
VSVKRTDFEVWRVDFWDVVVVFALENCDDRSARWDFRRGS